MVADVLSWRPAAARHRELHDRFAAASRDRFEAMLDRFVRAHIGDRLRSIVGELPEASTTRLVLAPESGRRLHYGPPHDLHFFLTGALAELRRLDPARAPGRPVWTALGDCWFPAEGADGAYHAPRLAPGIPVDTRSPYAALDWAGPTVAYRPEALREVVTAADAALAAARRISPEAHHLVTSSVRVVVARRGPGDAATSFSTERRIGGPAFGNLAGPPADPAGVLDRLLHEAVHSFLYLVERDEPLLRDRAAADRVPVASPWTGRRLHLHSFAHACCVWFALWSFWRRPAAAREFPADRVAALAGRARDGFDRPAMIDALRTAEPFLTPGGRAVAGLVDAIRHGSYD
ncbi:hypothetical protein GCM10020358_61140 [Amorphoplanes nipponensis]|uniref:HEXXH motif-containing protein n=1 Tax=Actinoplanes nipponensis TaxID=135950 RepID=A0A919MR68_9ACTN|nr:HEXXH motif-containing putative peptide modification protein [Actinoplanes nipponensis]GIE53917.1 hypothetical protein Ani05nite_74510 [Actinoplanes nipponensis]